MSLAFNNREVRPTPTQRNGNAEAMRAVPQFEPRTIVGNRVSPWERLATEIGGHGYFTACAAPGDPLFYQPQHLAEIGGDYGILEYEGAPVSDTMHRMVSAVQSPAFLRGTMQSFIDPHAGLSVHKGLRGLGDDDLPDDFFSGLSASPTLPTDSSGLPSGFFSGASASPIVPTGVSYAPPVAPNLANDLVFAQPTITVPTFAPTSTANAAATQQAAAITSLASVANTGIKAATTPSAAALTAQQQALLAAQNPLNTIVPGLNMSVGTLLLMGGVLIAGAVLISKVK